MTEELIRRIEAVLRDHWLAQMVCDHEAKTDQAVCACSVVDLGKHSSVGDAVTSWVEHVIAVLAAAPPADGSGG